MRHVMGVTAILLLVIFTLAFRRPSPAVAPTVVPPTTTAAVVAATTTLTPTPIPSAVARTPAAANLSVSTEKQFEEIDPQNFDRSTVIDNEWFPLKPGTQFTYEGHTEQEGQLVPHRVVFTVTDLTKVIDSVHTVVVYDTDEKDGQLVEKELTFFAQDKDGNVWHLGQYRETYDGVEFIGGRVWVVGNPDGAKAGIMMKAEPRLGLPSYSEGYAPPPFNWTDRGRISQMGQRISVPYGNYEDVLVIEEFSNEEPGGLQLKYYARGVGNVGVGWSGTDPNRETLGLVDLSQLSAQALATVRTEALELEKRAYMYGHTLPAESAK